MKNRLSASEITSSRRGCADAGAREWVTALMTTYLSRSGPQSDQRLDVVGEGRNIRGDDGGRGFVDARVEAGHADDEAGGDARREHRDARPGRREIPVEQDGRPAQPASALARQRGGGKLAQDPRGGRVVSRCRCRQVPLQQRVERIGGGCLRGVLMVCHVILPIGVTSGREVIA